MRIFWKYLFPVIFGLVIYASIRLVNDTVSGTQFWRRSWQINSIELFGTIVVSYLLHAIVTFFLRKNNQRSHSKLTLSLILSEFLVVALCCIIALNLTITPLVAFTDDGLQVADFAIINLIPPLYVLLYYAVARGNLYMAAFAEQQILMERIKNDQLQTELKFLKAQYHPHFLFNALNTIYFQMDEDVQAAKKSVERFSELLRYQIYDQQAVPVSSEINYLQNFIDLQKVRTSEKLKLETHFDSSLNGQKIYPLLLLPLVENAFKYVGGEYKLRVEALKQNDKLHFLVANSLPEQRPPHKHGIGLENLRRRLQLLYPGNHELQCLEKESQFLATLEVPLL